MDEDEEKEKEEQEEEMEEEQKIVRTFRYFAHARMHASTHARTHALVRSLSRAIKKRFVKATFYEGIRPISSMNDVSVRHQSCNRAYRQIRVVLLWTVSKFARKRIVKRLKRRWWIREGESVTATCPSEHLTAI